MIDFLMYHLASLSMMYGIVGSLVAVALFFKWRHDRKPKEKPPLPPSEKVGFYEGRGE